MTKQKNKFRVWEYLKQKFNNTYIDVIKFEEAQQTGVKLIA